MRQSTALRANPHLVASFHRTEAAIDERFTDVVAASFDILANDNKFAPLMSQHEPSAADDFWYSSDDYRSQYRPYMVVNGILHVPVKGVLLHNFAWSFGSYATGYAYIWKAIERGLTDPDVKGIAFIIDSPGGMVAGCFELCDYIFAQRGVKPMQSFVMGAGYSAAYAIASAPGKIVVTRTGGVGSIGVVTYHVDQSKALEDAGLKVTYIYKGKHKVDGNSTEPLAADVKQRIEDRLEIPYSIFCESVARNRNLEESAVRATEALTYSAQEAVAASLADTVGAFESTVADFIAVCDGDGDDNDQPDDEASNGDNAMTTKTEGQATATITEADVATARTEAATAERNRISAILASDEAKDRQSAAVELALDDQQLSADSAKRLLAKLPTEKPQASQDGKSPRGDSRYGSDTRAGAFTDAMRDNRPQVKDGAGDGQGEEETTATQRILAAQKSANSGTRIRTKPGA